MDKERGKSDSMQKITIYSKAACVNCDMALALAEKKGMQITVLKLERDYEVEDFTARFPYAKTVPQIILDGKHIGGYDNLLDVV